MSNSQAFIACKLKLELVCPGSTTGQPVSYPHFRRNKRTFNKWLHNIQLDLIIAEIPERFWPYAGLLSYLPDFMKMIMKKERKRSHVTDFDRFGMDWTWEQFIACFKSALQDKYSILFDAFIGQEIVNEESERQRKSLALQNLRSELQKVWVHEKPASAMDISSTLCIGSSDMWIKVIESSIRRLPLAPPKLWAYIGMMFLPDDIRDCMKQLQRGDDGFKTYGLGWSWDEFRVHLDNVLVQEGKDNASVDVKKLINIAAGIGITAAAVVSGAAVGPALIVGGLRFVGFQAAGVRAGTAASVVQSIFWKGATGGIFSLCQSVGATGVVSAAGTVTSAVASGAVAAAGYFDFGGAENDDEDDRNSPVNRSNLDGRD